MLLGQCGQSATAYNTLSPYNTAQILTRNFGTKSKNFATLYAKSGLSAIADNPVSVYSTVQFFEKVPDFIADN